MRSSSSLSALPIALLALSRFRSLRSYDSRFTRACGEVARHADPSASFPQPRPSRRRRGSPSRRAIPDVCACTRADSESALPTA